MNLIFIFVRITHSEHVFHKGTVRDDVVRFFVHKGVL